MTSGSGDFDGGTGIGPGRHRGRFAENAKPLAAILIGSAALLVAIAGTIALVCSDPCGDPASAVTTTAAGVEDGLGGGVVGGGGTVSPPAPPAPQWQGAVQIDSLGYSLATIPPSPDQSGHPDISASFDGTFFAALGAALWSGTATPSPQACATLLLTKALTHVTALPGDTYCVRVAHSALEPGNQYAAVFIVGQGRDSTDFPYVRVRATVWPDQG